MLQRVFDRTWRWVLGIPIALYVIKPDWQPAWLLWPFAVLFLAWLVGLAVSVVWHGGKAALRRDRR